MVGNETLSIAVIEDNSDSREMLRTLLEFERFQVHTASEGLSGLELLLRTRPHFAMIDIGLPGMNGYEIAKAARAEGVTSFLIAFTGYTQAADREAAFAAGFDQHIAKPINFDHLMKLLQKAVDQRSMIDPD